MKLIFLSFKNILENPRRSATLGVFVLLVSLLMVVANSFFSSVKSNMFDSIINAFTGNVLIRSTITDENVLFTMKGKWDKVGYMDLSQIQAAEKILKNSSNQVSYVKRVRQNVFVATNAEKQAAMVIGLDANATAYKNTLKLTSGRYFEKGKSNEIILNKNHAEKLKVKVGDSIDVLPVDRGENSTSIKANVVGIGNLELLESFEFPIAYMDLESTQKLAGFKAGEISDIAVYIQNKDDAVRFSELLTQEINKDGILAGKSKVTTWEELGGYIANSIGMYIFMFNIFIGIMMFIIAILIINLIFMMGIERRQEIGTLRAIGFSRGMNVFIFMSEIIGISTIFMLVGVVIGGAIVFISSKVGLPVGPPLDYLTGKQFYPKFDVTKLFSSMLIVFTFVTFASFYPCYRVASLKPAETIKEI